MSKPNGMKFKTLGRNGARPVGNSIPARFRRRMISLEIRGKDKLFELKGGKVREKLSYPTKQYRRYYQKGDLILKGILGKNLLKVKFPELTDKLDASEALITDMLHYLLGIKSAADFMFRYAYRITGIYPHPGSLKKGRVRAVPVLLISKEVEIELEREESWSLNQLATAIQINTAIDTEFMLAWAEFLGKIVIDGLTGIGKGVILKGAGTKTLKRMSLREAVRQSKKLTIRLIQEASLKIISSTLKAMVKELSQLTRQIRIQLALDQRIDEKKLEQQIEMAMGNIVKKGVDAMVEKIFVDLCLGLKYPKSSKVLLELKYFIRTKYLQVFLSRAIINSVTRSTTRCMVNGRLDPSLLERELNRAIFSEILNTMKQELEQYVKKGLFRK